MACRGSLDYRYKNKTTWGTVNPIIAQNIWVQAFIQCPVPVNVYFHKLSRAFPFKCTNSQADENLTTAPMHPRKEPVIFLNWATYIRHLLHWRQPDHVLVDLHSEHHVGRPLHWLPVQVAETQPASFVHEKKNKTLIWYPPDRVYVFMCTFMWFQYEDQFPWLLQRLVWG